MNDMRLATTPLAPTRRRLLAGLGTALLAGPAALAGSAILAGPAAAAGGSFRAIRVDTGPLAALGVSRYAAVVRTVMEPIAARVFAGRIQPGDRRLPTLVLVVQEIQMASYGGGSGFGRDGMDRPLDWISGAGLVVDAAGRTVERVPITAQRDATDGGPWYLTEQSERRRLENLCEALASWVARAV